MTFQEAVDYLSSLQPLGMRLSLERIQALCDVFGHPERRFPSVHVTGTNGKGSTCTMLASILSCSGLRTGLFVSPYVINVRERVQVNGRFISEDQFAELIEELVPAVEQVALTVGHPTEFEVKTMLGFLHFARAQVDYAVLEVGMGGRYDSTNVVLPQVTAITNVALDHTDRLGTTVEQIAWEKAGIIKPGVPCVTAAQGGALEVIQRECASLGSPLHRLGEEVQIQEGPDGTFSVSTPRTTYGDLRTAMLGAHQRLNAAVAVAVADILSERDRRVTPDAVREGLLTAAAPGRLEVICRRPTVLLDGAHNPHGAEHLREAISSLFGGRRTVVVMGMLKGHSVQEVVRLIAPLADVFIATSPDSPRAYPADVVADAAATAGAQVETVVPVPMAVARALELAGPEDLLCVTGSFYTVGEARQYLVSQRGLLEVEV
ncbi:MAG: bifunctional folylpolyglutamate synthase/dihydrofolate synthase [Armatimonadota bacterium]